MYHTIASALTAQLQKHDPRLGSADMREICTYGIEISLSTLLNYVLLLILGILFRALPAALIFAVVFTVTRLYTGGYHCTSYLRCNLTFCCIFITVILLGRFLLPYFDFPLLLLLLAADSLAVFCIRPVENHNKPLTVQTRSYCHKIAKWLCIADCLLAVIGYTFEPYYGITAALSLSAVVLLLPIGQFAEERRRNGHEEECGTASR